MNEINQNQPGAFELPKPLGETQGAPEKDAHSPEQQPIPTTPPPASMPTTDPSQLAKPVQIGQLQDDATNATASVNDLDAHDLDVIEKEWVKKAKEIIARTTDDPHKQKDELTAFSADYLKKRYGKDIKLEKQ